MRAKSKEGEKNVVSDGSEERSPICAWSGVEDTVSKLRTVLLWDLYLAGQLKHRQMIKEKLSKWQ